MRYRRADDLQVRNIMPTSKMWALSKLQINEQETYKRYQLESG